MELTNGTIIKSNIEDRRNFITVDAYYEIGYSEEYGHCSADDNHVNIDGYSYKTSSFEIIGKEPMLNDVMQYLWKLVEEESENSDDVIFAIGQLTNVFDQHCWNLSNPYLKDQSPELIKFLHSLIKTKQ